MAIGSPHGALLEKWLSVDLLSLRELSKTHPDEATELINRIRNFIKTFRPDLFERSDQKNE